MKLTLREKKNKDTITLYIDVYEGKGKRGKPIFPNLKLIRFPKTKEDREYNKEIRQKAEIFHRKKQDEYLNEFLGIPSFKTGASFIKYIEQYIENRKASGSYDEKIYAVKLYLEKYLENQDISFKQVTESFLENFKFYLVNKATKENDKKLSRNSAAVYFRKIKKMVHLAYREGIIPSDPAKNVDGIKEVKTQREFLELPELKKLVESNDWNGSDIKKAFIFSCYTGLRYSDIEKLKWSDIKYSDEKGHYIEYTHKKTQEFDKLYVSDYVFDFIHLTKNGSELVFSYMKKAHAKQIKTWVRKCGIDKDVTFHCARHTNATLLLENGADLYTVSKVLGHQDIATTQVYLHLIDKKLMEAATLIPNLFNNVGGK